MKQHEAKIGQRVACTAGFDEGATKFIGEIVSVSGAYARVKVTKDGPKMRRSMVGQVMRSPLSRLRAMPETENSHHE